MLNLKHLSGYTGFSGIIYAFILKIIPKCLSQQHRSGDSYSQNQQKRVLKSCQVELFSFSCSPLLLCAILQATAPSQDYSAPVPTLTSMALPGAATVPPAAVPLGFTRWALGARSVCSQATFNLDYISFTGTPLL